MKTITKIILIAASCAAMAACGGKGDDGIPEGKYADKAASYDLTSDLVLSDGTSLTDIEFTGDGEAIITKESGTIKKATITTYDFSSTKSTKGTYTVKGFGTVEVDGTNLTITEGGKKLGPVSANVKLIDSGLRNADKQFFHTWKVDRTILLVKGGTFGTVGVGKTFDGCNATAIANYIKDQGVTIEDIDTISGYSVKTITLSPTGTIAIEFSNPDNNYLGTWGYSGGAFRYAMTIGVNNSIINTNATGTATIKGKKAELVIKGTFTVNGVTYDTQVEFTLSVAK